MIVAPAAKVVGDSYNPCASFLGQIEGDWVVIGPEKVKHVRLNETWEKHWISFMVH